MAKNNRKNALDVLGIGEKEVIRCTICGAEMKDKLFVVQHDYVCEKCFLEYREELEMLETLDLNEIQEIKEEIAKIENVENNKEMVEMKNNELVTKVNNGIKYAILQGKNAKVEQRFIPAKQLIAIEKSYKRITGLDMSDEQMMYIKCCNPKQISNIIHTLNVANKTLVMA